MTAYKKTDIKRSTFCIFFALFPRTIINTESIRNNDKTIAQCPAMLILETEDISLTGFIPHDMLNGISIRQIKHHAVKRMTAQCFI